MGTHGQAGDERAAIAAYLLLQVWPTCGWHCAQGHHTCDDGALD